jgi:hypothetical protein
MLAFSARKSSTAFGANTISYAIAVLITARSAQLRGRMGRAGQTHQPPCGVALKSTARAGKGEPKSHQNACAAFGRPQFRLRIGGTRMFYNISSSTAEVLTIVTKLEAEAWLRQFGHPV